jgi:arginyl-tRNA synthetase
MYQDNIKKAISKATGLSGKDIHIEKPESEEFGDYSTNVAMQIVAKAREQEGKRAGESKENKNIKQLPNTNRTPRQVAEEIIKKLQSDKELEVVEKIEVAGPGFINFWLSKDILLNNLIQIDKDNKKFGSSSVGKGKTVVIDYSSPNIAKRFSIGHLRSTIIGQALYNLYSFLGYKVIGDNHLGDWGTQFGKLIYMIKKENIKDFSIDKLEELYVLFHKLTEDPAKNEDMENAARQWFKKLEDGDSKARSIWEKCVEVSMEEFDKIYALLDIKIDYAYGESSYEGEMKKMIKETNEGKLSGLVHSQGAWVMAFKDLSAPLIFQKSDGATTYATRDLACIRFRVQKWDPDIIIYEVGAEQTLHFQQVFLAARNLGFVDNDVTLYHTKHGLYLAENGKKFKTRKGGTIKLEDILNEAIDMAKELGNEGDTAKEVGVGAIKYYDLMHGVQSDIVFNWKSIMNLEGNSGPYIQYAFARTQSVLEKSGVTKERKSRGGLENFAIQDFNNEELSLLRTFIHFPEVIAESAEKFSPNLLCNYLYNLAQKFNTFYNLHDILEQRTNNKEQSQFRLELTKATGQILKNGLDLLGIKAPEKM